ncbi:MAG: aminotransferase class I/II-fold pyridoxal phosphate-dependent enzyme [Bdellovibrionales bacterium]
MLICRDDASVIDAMRLINQSGKGIVFIVDKNEQYVGVLTDGDIRRGIIQFNNIPTSVGELVNRSAVSFPEGTTESEIIQSLKAAGKPYVLMVPLLKDGKIVRIVELEKTFYAPIANPTLNGNEMLYVYECVTTGWISSQGRFVRELERQFSKKYEAAYSTTVMNGTAAIHLALEALGIGEGDEVIIPSLTFAACINAVLQAGASPVLVDVERDSWCISPTEIEKNITDKTKAIMPVHLYGQVCDMDAILAIAKKHQLFVVEDCAEAQGAKYKDKYVGTMGDIGCFSFFGNKIMTTGEGGMCTTSREDLHQKMQKMRDHGMSRDHRLYYHDMVGFNYRMTNLQAAIGLAQMERVDDFQAQRKRIQNKYNEVLSNVPGLQKQVTLEGREKVCWLASYLLTNNVLTRDELILLLKAKGIDTRPFFFPLHMMEIYKKYQRSECPNSEFLSQAGFNLPTFIGLSDAEVEKVAHMIEQLLAQNALKSPHAPTHVELLNLS